MIVPGAIFDSAANFVRPPAPGYGFRLYGATSGFVGFKPATVAGSADYELPAADAAGCWVSNGSGGLSIESATATRSRLGLATTDDVTFDDLTVSNLTVNGPVTRIHSAELTLDDPLIKLGDNNVADTLDLGFYGLYVASGSKYAGLFRDATDGKFRLFTALEVEPTTTVNIGGTGYTAAHLIVGTMEATTYIGLPASGGNPAGTGTELQYRVDGTTFGAVTGSGTESGKVGINKASSIGAQLHVVSSSSTTIGQIVQGASGQSVNLAEWQNVGGTVLSYFDSSGSLTIGGAGDKIKIHASPSSAVAKLTTDNYLYAELGASAALRIFIGGTQYYDLSAAAMGLLGPEIRLASAGGSSVNFIKRSSSDPIGVNGDSITTPLWITGVDGFPGNTAAARHALDINFSLGAGGTPDSGTVTGGNAGKLNVYLRAAGAGSGGAAAGSDGVFRVLNASSVTLFSVEQSGTVTIGDTVNVVVNVATGTKWGTATGQKQAWWNATPVVQPAFTDGSNFTANTSANTFFAESTSTGGTGSTAYKFADVIKCLKTSGLIAA